MPAREGRSGRNKQPHTSGLSSKSASLSAPSRWEGRGPALILEPQAPPLRTLEHRLAGEEWRDHERGWGRGVRSRGSWRCWGPRHGISEHRQEVGEGWVLGGSGHRCQLQKPQQRRPVGFVWAWAQQGDAGRETVGGEQAGGRPGVSSCTVTSLCAQASSRASVHDAGRALLGDELQGLVVQLPQPRAPTSGELGPGVLAWGQKGPGSLQGGRGAGQREARKDDRWADRVCPH